jgi:galactonate dehydratase
LSGGPFRQQLSAYISGLRQPTLEEQCRAARALTGQGFRAFKLFLGHGVESDSNTLRTLRRALGEDIELMCDLLWRYRADDALRLGRVLDAEHYRWLEAPVAPEDIAAHQRLAQTLDTAIAVGEALRTPFEFQPWFDAGAIGVVQPDVMRCGLSGAMKIAAQAEVRHLPVAPHVGVGLGIGIAATWQFAAAIPNFLIQEYQHELMTSAGSILATPLQIADGRLIVPVQPGLGIEVDEDAVQAAGTEHWTQHLP